MNRRAGQALLLLPLLVVLAVLLFLRLENTTGFAEALSAAARHGFFALSEPFGLLTRLGAETLQRTELAAQVELLFLTTGSALIIFLLSGRRFLLAAVAVVLAAAVGLIVFWIMAQQQRIYFDFFYAVFGFLCIYLSGALLNSLAGIGERRHLRRVLAPHLPSAIMAQIVRRPSLLNLKGESREVTYLVCGIRGFAQLSEQFVEDPVGFSRLLRRIMTPLGQTVLNRKGAVDRIAPGCLTAFFNAPLDDPKHAVHACECALHMTEDLEKVNRALEQERRSDDSSFPTIAIGIGVAGGACVAGDFGPTGHSEYSVAGRTALLAAELQKLSARYGPAIIVNETTRAAAERNFAFLEVDLMASAAQPDPASLFALLGNPLMRASPKFRAVQTFHHHIFEAYRARDWEKARELIVQCRQLSGASPQLYDLYLARIAQYEEHPPGENWNGTFRPDFL